MRKKCSDKKKLKLPIKRILDDNIFMLRLIHQASPGLLLAGIVTVTMHACAEFVSGTLVLRYTLNSINEGKSFAQIARLVLIWMFLYVTVSVIRTLFDEWIYKVHIMHVKRNIYGQVYQKASEVELKCYENPEYYDKFVKAIDECGTRAEEIIQNVRNLIYRIVSFVLNGSLIVFINPFLMFFALIPLLVSFVQVKVNQINYKKTMEIKKENRNKDYSRRVFYLADYAKEMRLSNMPLFMLTRFRESGERVIEIIQKYGYSTACLKYIVTECRDMLAPLGATFYAAWQAFVAKSIGYGDCLVIVNSIDQVSGVLTQSSNELLKFQESALYIENLREFLDYEPQIKSGTEKLPVDGDIILDNVSFRYDGAAEDTLHNVSMRFGAKERIAIVGQWRRKDNFGEAIASSI